MEITLMKKWGLETGAKRGGEFLLKSPKFRCSAAPKSGHLHREKQGVASASGRIFVTWQPLFSRTPAVLSLSQFVKKTISFQISDCQILKDIRRLDLSALKKQNTDLHILFNFNQKRAKLLITMHFFCLLLAKIISIYAFSVCKILSPENLVV